LSQSRRCLYCQSSFLPSVYRPQQSVCSQRECQRRRRSDYHRKKLATDPNISRWCATARSSGGTNIPTTRNSTACESNRQRQRLRDRKRRVKLLVRNNLALDLKHSASEVWLLGPKVRDLDRNNLASAQVLILPSLGQLPEALGPS
jgi:hypothetical protein